MKDILESIMKDTGYVDELRTENTEEALSRIENVEELLTKVVTYEESTDEPTLSGFLEEVALIADIDSLENSSDYVVLMTIHSAKGLEFPRVYLSGMEDGVFPSYMCLNSDDPTDIEEERRLCYVAITRAMKKLIISCARARMVRGETQYNKMSRFVGEIPGYLLNKGTTTGKSTVGAGLPAMQTTRTVRHTAAMPSRASPLPHWFIPHRVLCWVQTLRANVSLWLPDTLRPKHRSYGRRRRRRQVRPQGI